MNIREIKSKETLDIRLEILRPNGTLKDCVFLGDDDHSTKHFGAFINDSLVGIVSIYRVGNASFQGLGFQIRAMATLPEARGKGAGYYLLKRAEAYAFNNDTDYVWANARTSAKEFYRKAGYCVSENEFNIEGIGSHVIVSKLNA